MSVTTYFPSVLRVPTPAKNIATLIRGMEFLPGRVLHLMSPMSEKSKSKQAKVKPHGVKIIYHGGFDALKEAKILADDALLVSASLSEGFGLPTVEAMEFGVPVVLSDIPVFHEVAGPAARYFNPLDPRAFADAVQSVDSQEVRAEMAKKGMAEAQKFDWEKSAAVILETAKRLSKGSAK